MKILIIDSNYLCHKAMHTGANELTWEEKETGIIFGFLLQIFKLAKDFGTNKFAFCWDSKKSYRQQKYSGYKEKRHTDMSPEEWTTKKLAYKQFSELRCDVLPALGFKNIFIQTGYEADDLIAALVYVYPESIVVSVDNDLWQLLDFCSMYDVKKKKMVTRESFVKEWKIEPLQWGDVKCIAGCSGDEVSGVKGVGNITAVKYIRGELSDGVIKSRIDSDEGKGIIERNKKLVVLPCTDKCNRVIDLEEVFKLYNFTSIFKKYGFMSMLSKTYINRLRDTFELS